MRIGEVAERASVPTKTIRYYEEVGLLPQPPRTAGGYRDYGGDVIERLGFIRAAQSIGLSIGEIREILSLRDRGEAPCAHVTALIEKHARDLADRISRLRQMQTELGRLATVARSMSPEGGRFCHLIERASPSSARGKRWSGTTAL